MLTIYERLEEPDLVIGAAAVRETEPGMQDLIHLHTATGNYQDAIACYDKMKTDPWRHLSCLLDIGLPKAAADRAAAYIKEDSSLSKLLAAAQVDAGEILRLTCYNLNRFVIILILIYCSLAAWSVGGLRCRRCPVA